MKFTSTFTATIVYKIVNAYKIFVMFWALS